MLLVVLDVINLQKCFIAINELKILCYVKFGDILLILCYITMNNVVFTACDVLS